MFHISNKLIMVNNIYYITIMRTAKTIFPLLSRNYPRIARKLILPTFFTLHQLYIQRFGKVDCSGSNYDIGKVISKIQENVIRIEKEGNHVGEAYCFAQNYLVSVSYGLEFNQHHNQTNYEFYLGNQKLEGSFKIIGHFQNLTFIQHNLKKQLKPLQYQANQEKFQMSAVQIFKKKEYPSIKNGYIVARDSGFGIIDGHGQIGGLVIKNGMPVGIVSHIGREVQSDFLRIVEWRNLPKILKYIKEKSNIHFGISVQAQLFKQGIQVVRIAPNSPFKNDLMMGDRIVRANTYTIGEVESLKRICVMSEGQLVLEIIRDDSPMEIKVRVY